MSVYLFTKDTKDSGTSACTGSCIAAWPPVLTGSAAPAVEGVTGKVGTIPTPDGKKQLTINGMPVYYFAKDRAPGDITGQGVGNVWYLVNPAGGMITSAAGGGYWAPDPGLVVESSSNSTAATISRVSGWIMYASSSSSSIRNSPWSVVKCQARTRSPWCS